MSTMPTCATARSSTNSQRENRLLVNAISSAARERLENPMAMTLIAGVSAEAFTRTGSDSSRCKHPCLAVCPSSLDEPAPVSGGVLVTPVRGEHAHTAAGTHFPDQGQRRRSDSLWAAARNGGAIQGVQIRSRRSGCNGHPRWSTRGPDDGRRGPALGRSACSPGDAGRGDSGLVPLIWPRTQTRSGA